MDNVRIAVDVGGTFTDIALEHAEGMTTKKVLTTPDKPCLLYTSDAADDP